MPKAETQTSTRERDPDGRKERILTAAEEVFARHGFADSSVREISRLADVDDHELFAGNDVTEEVDMVVCFIYRGYRTDKVFAVYICGEGIVLQNLAKLVG